MISDPETHVRQALAGAIDFVAAKQLASGEIPVETALNPDMRGDLTPDPAIFPTALSVHCLSFTPATAEVSRRAVDFLATERWPGGLWRHWPRSTDFARLLPPDIDDTSCASAALTLNGTDGGVDDALLLSNRDRHGRFQTWFIPRLRWTGRRQLRLTWPQLLRLHGLVSFFAKTSAAPGDVDAVVNANVLFHLGAFDGHRPVVDFLCGILRDRRERDCDKWYGNPFVVWYFFARALAPLDAEATALLAGRIGSEAPRTALDRLLLICTQLTLGRDVERALLDELLSEQRADGSWPAAALYNGGRRRLGDGRFAPPHPDTPHWGSSAITTVFAIEALARYGGALA